jgi:hypothetical protein
MMLPSHDTTWNRLPSLSIASRMPLSKGFSPSIFGIVTAYTAQFMFTHALCELHLKYPDMSFDTLTR